ncbi:MAG: DUF3857 domain-containing protein [Lacibacter sp.]
MKTLHLLLAFTLCTSSLFAQKIPSFGKIDKADLLYKECSYDKDAAAEYLIDYGEVNYFFSSADFVNETRYRIRIKILKEKALELANVRIPFYKNGNREKITSIDGYTYNLDEKGEVVETKMEKKTVMTQKLDKDHDMIVFTLPNVKIGSVIEYRYEDAKKNAFEIEDWSFQRSYPVRYSEYNATIPSIFDFTYLVKHTLPIKETTEGINNMKRFVMTNIPGLDKEPYMSCSKDYLQRVDFQLRSINQQPVMQTWDALITELLDHDDFGRQIKKNVLNHLPLEDDLKKMKTEYEKLVTLIEYVKKNVTWNGNSYFICEKGVKKALEDHSGNSADLNLLLLNLLRDAGLTSYPILVSTRDHGKINPFYPFIYQFNNVLVYVEADKEVYVIDASNVFTPPFLIPYSVQFADGYVVDLNNKRFIPLADTKHKYRILTTVSAEINEKGEINGDASVFAYEYARMPRLYSLSKGKDNLLKEHFSEPHPEFKFDSLTTENEKNDSLPFSTSVKFNSQLNSSGDFFFYSPNFLTELEKNEFISDLRFTDIEFGYTQQYNFITTIRFPSNFEPEELPKNMKMIMPDTSIILQRFMQKNDNSISFRITLEIKRPVYYADEYPYFKEFYRMLFDKINEQIVFKKKAKPRP